MSYGLWTEYFQTANKKIKHLITFHSIKLPNLLEGYFDKATKINYENMYNNMYKNAVPQRKYSCIKMQYLNENMYNNSVPQRKYVAS